jgi:hypothetical protein
MLIGDQHERQDGRKLAQSLSQPANQQVWHRASGKDDRENQKDLESDATKIRRSRGHSWHAITASMPTGSTVNSMPAATK